MYGKLKPKNQVACAKKASKINRTDISNTI